ncbi:MAG: hypothetical protein LIP11_18625 [Clostridiales bacterium]|nr:hypothetical protein [Clostridiales bacterium]
MERKINIKDLLDATRKWNTRIGDFTLGCQMPLQYRAGMPVFGKRNRRVYLIIPFNYCKITGVVDQTEVYPIRYTITLTLPDGRPVAYEDLSMNTAFGKQDFAKAVGYFRHDSIKNMKAAEYKALEAEIYDLYNQLLEDLLDRGETDAADEKKLSKLLGRYLPPALKPQYRLLDSDFYFTYLD